MATIRDVREYRGTTETAPYFAIQDEISPNFNESNIAIFIDTRLLQEIDAPEGKVHFVARKTLQGGCVITGFASRIPFIEMNIQAGGSNKVYGAVLAYGNCTSFGYLVAYSFLEIINSQMDPMTSREKLLKESRLSPCVKKTIFISSTILGFVSQIPFAYMAYRYNDSNDNNNCTSSGFNSTNAPGDGAPDTLAITMAALVFAFDSWVYVNSAYQGMKALRERQAYTAYERELSHARQRMHSLVDENIELLSMVSNENRRTLTEAYARIKKLDQASNRIEALHSLFTSRITDLTIDPPAYAKYLNWTMKGWGYVCALSNLGALSYMAWLGTEQLCDLMGVEITVTAIYVGTALYLNKTAIPETAVKLFNIVKNIFTCGYRPTISDQLTPKLSFCLKGIGLATAALSYGPGVQLSRDYFCFNDGFEVFMEISLSCATIFLVSMAVLDITDKALENKIARYGSEDEKQIIQLYKDMKVFSNTLKKSPLIDLAQYLKILPEGIFNQIVEGTDITLENLEAYIQTNKRPIEEGTTLLTHV